jgi:hypothetical protein
VVGGPYQAGKLAFEAPDAGSAVSVLTPWGPLEATLGPQLAVSVPDAGRLAGAPVLDASGAVFALMGEGARAMAVGPAVDLLRASLPGPRADGARWRNLGISGAFFLGLAVWWVYRSRAPRY